MGEILSKALPVRVALGSSMWVLELIQCRNGNGLRFGGGFKIKLLNRL